MNTSAASVLGSGGAGALSGTDFARFGFPLPMPPPLDTQGAMSRRSAQRQARKSRIRFELREMVAALNWMHTGSFSLESLPGSPSWRTDPFVEQRLGKLVSYAGRLGTMSRPPSGEAALRELLAGNDEYNLPSSPIGLAPYNLELISLPDDLAQAPAALDLLGDDDRRYLLEQERMMKPGPLEGKGFSSPYWDPALKNSPKHYRQFIQKLDSIKYLNYTLHPVAHAGMFFVYKSDGRRLRLIVDARPANELFRDPPGVSLSTAETFSRFQYVPTDLKEYIEQSSQRKAGVSFGLSDIRDCFHRIRQPAWLSKHFCLLPIKAKYVGLSGAVLEGVRLEPDSMVFPMPGSLCMGFSWSLYFAQRISEQLMRQVPALAGSHLASDRGAPVSFSDGDPERTHHYVYVDNLGVMSLSEEKVAAGLDQLTKVFNDKGLLLHGGEVGQESVRALGVELNGASLTTTLTPERFHRVRAGLRALLRRGRCSGRALERVVGHCTYCGLLNRGTLSVFHAVYKFIQKHYEQSAALWPSVKVEIRVFAGLMSFLVCDWTRPWSEVVYASDASEEGFGVCSARWNALEAKNAGDVKERSRFRRSGGHNARESALSSAGFVKDGVTGQWRAGEMRSEEYLNAAGWEIDDSFPEISGALLSKSAWDIAQAGEWSRPEHIVHLEARALVKSFEISVEKGGHGRYRQLLLSDSMSAVLAFERGRARNFRILRHIRRLYATALLYDVDVHFRWIPSELNPADGPSRLASKVESKSLLSQLPLASFHGAQRAWDEEGSDPAARDLAPRSRAKADKDAGAPLQAARANWRQDQQNTTQTGLGRRTSQQELAGRCRPRQRGRAARPAGDQGRCGPERQFQQYFRTSGVQETDPTFGPEVKEASEEVCDRADGSSRPGSEPSGEEGRDCQDGGLLHEGVRPVFACGNGGRQEKGEFPGGQPCLAGRCSAQGRQGAGGHYAPPPGLWPLGFAEVAPSMAEPQRLASPGTRAIPAGLSTGGMGGAGVRDQEIGPSTHGSLPSRRPQLLRQAERAFEMPGRLSGSAGRSSGSVLEFGSQPRRGGGAVQSGHVRRECRVRLSLAAALGPPGLPGPYSSRCCDATLGLPVLRLCDCLRLGRQPYPGSSDAVPVETFRSLYRRQPKVAKSCRGAETRKMEATGQCGPVRAQRTARNELQCSADCCSAPLPPRRATARGCDEWHHPRSQAFVKWRGHRGFFVIDLFSGTGGVAKSVRRLGFAAKEWDLQFGPQFDLTQPSALKKLKHFIRSGYVLAAMLAPPCTSFSVARDRTKQLRSWDKPWGIWDIELSEKERDSLLAGNRCCRAALHIIKWLDELRLPWILEHPRSSRCWILPEILRIANAPHTQLIHTDFCQWGKPWKKPTTLLAGHVDALDAARLQRQCSGCGGLCSRTHKRHFQLTGSGPHAVPWTRLAQPYPKDLCDQLAWVLTAPYHVNPPSHPL